MSGVLHVFVLLEPATPTLDGPPCEHAQLCVVRPHGAGIAIQELPRSHAMPRARLLAATAEVLAHQGLRVSGFRSTKEPAILEAVPAI